MLYFAEVKRSSRGNYTVRLKNNHHEGDAEGMDVYRDSAKAA